VAADIASDFTAAGGVTNVNGISQVKRFDKRGQIIGVRVHLFPSQGCLDRP
jgi:phosphoribosylformimino-5-aminoimidazole carboxamide ribonucleotide (ProFAR) isomerase